MLLHAGAADDDASKGEFSGPVSKDGEFRNWAGSVQTKPARVFTPKSASEVQQLLAQVMNAAVSLELLCSYHMNTFLYAIPGIFLLCLFT